MNTIDQYRAKAVQMSPSDIQYEYDTSLMKYADLRNKYKYNFEKDFTVVELDLDAVLDKLDISDLADNFRSSELMIDQHMPALIDFVGTGAKLIPPILLPIGKRFSIFDGKHRIGLTWHKGIKKVPFLVRKTSLQAVQAIMSEP